MTLNTCIVQLERDLSSPLPQHQVDALGVCWQLWQPLYLKRNLDKLPLER